MTRFSSVLLSIVALLMASCVGMLGSQRVSVEIPERQNWNGATLHGDIAQIEEISTELTGRYGAEAMGDEQGRTTTVFNLRGDVLTITTIDAEVAGTDDAEFDEIFREVMAEELIETDILSVGEYDTLGDMVVKVIPHTKRNIFPVLSEEKKLLGVIEFDRLRKDMFDQTKYPNSVKRYMNTPPDIIHINESATSVLEKFEQTGAWNLPVVDKNDCYLGFLSKSNILTAYREKLREMTQE